MLCCARRTAESMLACALAIDPVTASFTVCRAVPAWLILLFVELASCCSLVTDVRIVARSVRVFARLVSVRVFAVFRLPCEDVTLDEMDESGEFTLSMAPDIFDDARVYSDIACWKSALARLVSDPEARAESNSAIAAPMSSSARCSSSGLGLRTLPARFRALESGA